MLNKQSGFTIVELMVGLLLSLLLVGGIVQVYFGTKTTYKVTEGLSRLQENTRFSADILARDIRMAGYVPCSQPQNTANVVDKDDDDWWAQFFKNRIKGFEYGVSIFPAGISAAAGSDAILILRGGNKVAGVNFFNTTTNQFIMQRESGLDSVENGSLMIACDSTQATLFQAGDIQSNVVTVAFGSEEPGNSGAVNYAFGNDAQLTNYKAVIYYIAASVSGNGLSLFRKYLNVANSNSTVSDRDELIEGVENMQILYGIDSNSDSFADQYVEANDDVEWQEVVTVRVGLLMASEDGLNVESDSGDYIVANTSIGIEGDLSHAQDHRKRYVSEITVSIRNI